MSAKNTVFQKVSSAQSLSAAFTSPATVIKYLDNCSYQINITTTNSTGVFTVQGSVDYQVNEPSNLVTNPGTWTNLPLSNSIVAAGANDTILVSLNQLPFNAIRVSYTPTVAGTGVADIFIEAKRLG